MQSQHKTCRKCGRTKDADDFGIKVASPDGRDPHCRECRSSLRKGRPGQYRPRYAREYYEENREQKLRTVSAYKTANREFVRISNRARDHEMNSTSQSLADKSRKSWNAEEDKALMDDDRQTVYQKAVELGRSYRACIARRHVLRSFKEDQVSE